MGVGFCSCVVISLLVATGITSSIVAGLIKTLPIPQLTQLQQWWILQDIWLSDTNLMKWKKLLPVCSKKNRIC
jgi:hypothetical protein